MSAMLPRPATQAINHVLRASPLALERVRAHAGKTVAFHVGPATFAFTAQTTGEVEAAVRGAAHDVEVRLSPLVAARIAAGDEAAFDLVSVAFGLRNMTHKDLALAEMARVTRPGGRVIVLEFSKPWKPLAPAYDAYSFSVLPKLGKYVARDEAAYRYLAESIRMHPDQETLKAMMEGAGLVKAEYFNLAAGVVALHRGWKA